jgi:2-polyprenyl-3-methyl-5-hydroxy-6-metoxy-1,4-benzoquinol methylase
MDKEQLDDFDKFAHDYKAILDKSLIFGGEKGEYYSRYKAEYIARYVGTNFSGKILDYGCGIGLLSEVLLKHFPQASVDGYDVSAASIGHVPDFLKKQGSFTSDLSHLVAGYDLIIMANVLHHVEIVDREKEIAKLKKLVNNKGRVIVFEHNPFNPLTRKLVRDSSLDKGVVLIPSSEILFYFKNAKFQNIQLNYIVFFPKSFSALRRAEPYLSWLPLGAQYSVIGQA